MYDEQLKRLGDAKEKKIKLLKIIRHQIQRIAGV